MASRTANGEYNYLDVFHGKTLHEWVELAHKSLSIASNWKYFPLKRGSFGYDNMCCSIGELLKYMDKHTDLTLDSMANAVHVGWIKNYVYWRDNSPFLQKEYIKPSKPLGDKRRDECANLSYVDLPEDEKDKDRIIAKAIFENKQLSYT